MQWSNGSDIIAKDDAAVGMYLLRNAANINMNAVPIVYHMQGRTLEERKEKARL